MMTCDAEPAPIILVAMSITGRPLEPCWVLASRAISNVTDKYPRVYQLLEVDRPYGSRSATCWERKGASKLQR